MSVEVVSGVSIAFSFATFLIVVKLLVDGGRFLQKFDDLYKDVSGLKASVSRHDRQLVRLPHYIIGSDSAD